MTPDEAVEKVRRFQPKSLDVIVVSVNAEMDNENMAQLAASVERVVEGTGAKSVVIRQDDIEAFVMSQSAFDDFAEWLATQEGVTS